MNGLPMFARSHASPVSRTPGEDLVRAGTASRRRARRGFVLVVSLTLMVLLTVLAFGVLTLGSISLRTSGQGEAMAIARANARLALALAIGELQKQTGPDQRITVTADQLASGGDGDASAAATGRRFWTGVYDAWDAASATRPTPAFRGWLVSGEPSDVQSLELAKSRGSAAAAEMVGQGTLGANADQTVEAALVAVGTAGAGKRGRHAWWVGDQGVKAALSHPAFETPADSAATRQALLSAPRHAVEWASTPDGKPLAALDAASAGMPKITGWQQAGFLADKPENLRPLFHDLAAGSTGLLTNVRAGGFRRDLSLYLETSQAQAPDEPLYSVGGVDGINEAELWLYYHSYKELKTRTRASYTTGGSVGNRTPYLQVESSLSALERDPENLFKQPSFVSIQTVLSFYAYNVQGSSGTSERRLALVVDPIVVLWNPLDVPLVIDPAYYSVKFWQLPYDLRITRSNGTSSVISLREIMTTQYNYLTMRIGQTDKVVLKPGEVLMVSQGANTAMRTAGSGKQYMDAKPGWNFGGGIRFDIKDRSGNFIQGPDAQDFRYEITPNADQSAGSAVWFLTAHDIYYKEDMASNGERAEVGSITIDSLNGLPKTRILASGYPDFFGRIDAEDTRPLSFGQVAQGKEPFMLFSFSVKTETGADRPGRFFARYNPKAAVVDFQSLSAEEMETLPYEVHIAPLNSWRNRYFEVSTNGRGFFGGGWNQDTGNGIVITHSIPREPVHSLAAFQHAFANGFKGSSSGRFDPTALLPQISHPIGNSLAPSVIPADKTSANLEGPRPLADHSYLANLALWDDWFLSGIAPQETDTYAEKRDQQRVALDFFKQEQPLPNSRYRPALAGEAPEQAASLLFSGSRPSADAPERIASLLSVDGMFNVNSTSVEAWKGLLGGLKDHSVTVRTSSGDDSIENSKDVPVVSLFCPENELAERSFAGDVSDSAQWAGRRELSESEIDALARAVVREVRKRGPFLSLADFINRRPGSDKDLARAGAIQSALDSRDVPINDEYNTGSRSTNAGGTDRGFAFPEAEEGAAAYGIPGVVKQADILAPIAPYLSARSDTFLVRAYGDCIDDDGTILARAWCEASVQREASFVDAIDGPTASLAALSPTNRIFGRRYRVESFRWLHPSEI